MKQQQNQVRKWKNYSGDKSPGYAVDNFGRHCKGGVVHAQRIHEHSQGQGPHCSDVDQLFVAAVGNRGREGADDEGGPAHGAGNEADSGQVHAGQPPACAGDRVGHRVGDADDRVRHKEHNKVLVGDLEEGLLLRNSITHSNFLPFYSLFWNSID